MTKTAKGEHARLKKENEKLLKLIGAGTKKTKQR